MKMGWDKKGHFQVDLQTTTINSIEAAINHLEEDLPLSTSQHVRIPARSLLMIKTTTSPEVSSPRRIFEVVNLGAVAFALPNLYVVPLLHRDPPHDDIHSAVVNLSDKSIHLPKGAKIASLHPVGSLEVLQAKTTLETAKIRPEEKGCTQGNQEAKPDKEVRSPVSTIPSQYNDMNTVHPTPSPNSSPRSVPVTTPPHPIPILSLQADHDGIQAYKWNQGATQGYDRERELKLPSTVMSLDAPSSSRNSRVSPEDEVKFMKVARSKTDLGSPRLPTQISHGNHNTQILQSIPEEDETNSEVSLAQIKSAFITSPADIEVRIRPEMEAAPISEATSQMFEQLKSKFADIFSTHSGDLGLTPIIEMEIETGDSRPICQRPYTIPLKHQEWVKNEIDILEKAGIIERSISPWASPIVIVPKKSNPLEPPSKRLCVDYRALNALNPPTKRPNSKVSRPMTLTPLPRIDELLTRFHGMSIFSSIDLRSGFYHIVLTPESQKKSAFVTPLGKWEFKRVPFGLTQAPAYFQRVMDEVLAGYHSFSMGYLDDIVVFSKTEEEHLKHLELVFERLRKAGMKIKESKCAFLKSTMAYLGHVVSVDGIHPMNDKLVAVKQMPAPRNVKEVQQFLGLAGYYRKFVPRYSDIAKPLTDLLHIDKEFEWNDDCQKNFALLKKYLCSSPILTYPDPSKDYILYTDASKYGWAGLLMQEHDLIIEGEKVTKNLPIQYVSGKFRGPQINWAALVKEAYAIYQCVKKLNFYLDGSTCYIYSDHKPLEKFLERNTLNVTVNNWALELEQYDLKLNHVSGVKNALADALSRLIQIDPSYELPKEPSGQEFGKVVCSDSVRDQALITSIINAVHKSTTQDAQYLSPKNVNAHPTKPADNPTKFSDKISSSKWKQLQASDSYCQFIRQKLKQGKSRFRNHFLDGNLLMRSVKDGGQEFSAIVVPVNSRELILKLAHDELGHNSEKRVYSLVKKLYYWKGMQKFIAGYCRNCPVCREYNYQSPPHVFLHQEVPTQPIEYISMDLIGPFPLTAKGNKYALTVIDMFTSYAWCVPIPTKHAEVVLEAYLSHVYPQAAGSRKILSDNGTEFTEEIHQYVCKELGVEARVYSPAYHPQTNGKIEGFHRFLKTAIRKHVTRNVDWDEVTPLACAAYNFFPGENTIESPYFLLHGRDPILPISSLISPRGRYLGDNRGKILLQSLRNLYQLVAQKLKESREKRNIAHKDPQSRLEPGQMVLLKDHVPDVWSPRFRGPWRIVSTTPTTARIVDNSGKERQVHHTDLKLVDPGGYIGNQVPDYKKFGRNAAQSLDPTAYTDLTKIHDSLTDNTTTTTPTPAPPKYNLRSRKTDPPK